MIEVPTPTMVTTFSSIVATEKSELVYVKVPSLFELGGANVKVAVPIVFVGIEKLVKVGVP